MDLNKIYNYWSIDKLNKIEKDCIMCTYVELSSIYENSNIVHLIPNYIKNNNKQLFYKLHNTPLKAIEQYILTKENEIINDITKELEMMGKN